MKLRVRLGKQRFTINIGEENATVLTLKEAICKAASLRDISTIEISLNGTDIIDRNDVTLSSYGLVNGDLVYALSSAPIVANYAVGTGRGEDDRRDTTNEGNPVLLSQLVEMGFDEDVSKRALIQVNNTSVEAALDIIMKNELKTHTNSDQTRTNVARDVIHEPDYDNKPSTSTGLSQFSPRSCEVDHGEKVREMPKMADIRNPVFCRDGVSAALSSLYDTAGAQTQHEAVFVVIHALMLESGFQFKTTTGGEQTKPDEAMLLGWKNKSALSLQYVHNLDPSISCDVVVTSLGPFIYAHAWSSEIKSSSHQVKLVASQYIRGDVSLSSGAKSVYRNLHKASRLIKDHLVHPLLAAIRSHLGFITSFSLIGLPPEIQLMIFSQLTAMNVVRLCCTCKGLYSTCNDQKLWNFFCQRDFGVEKTTFASWKEEYKALHKKQQVQRQRMDTGHFILPQPFPAMPIFNPFLPRFPPGIIGGPPDMFPDFLNLPPQDERRLPLPLPDNSLSSLRPRTYGSSTSRTFPH